MYEPRRYRATVQPAGLLSFDVRVEQTDLMVMAEAPLSAPAHSLVRDARRQLTDHIRAYPDFATSMRPLVEPEPDSERTPSLVRSMYRAAALAGTGPMAAVAGAVSEYVGRGLLEQSAQLIIENGGDIFIATTEPRLVSIFAGESSLSMKVGLRLGPGVFGVCTSSGTVGHSYSMGRTDAATVISPDVALADAVATALGNRVTSREDISAALEWAKTIDGVIHAAVIVDEAFGTWGQLEVVPVAGSAPDLPAAGGGSGPAKEG